VLGYLDPGSTSVALGVVAGGVAGVAVAAKGALARIRPGKKSSKTDAVADVDSEQASETSDSDA
jgi:hypothetical protein